MKGLRALKTKSDQWWLKRALKPLYMPVIQRIKFQRNNRNFLRHGENVLAASTSILNELGVFHWLEFGTLLGVYRDGRLIAHDTDVDLGLFLGEDTKRIEQGFLKHGFKKVHRIDLNDAKTGLEESYERNGVKVDLFYFTKTPSGMHCHLFPLNQAGERLALEVFTSANEFEPFEWQCCRTHIPKDPHQRLTDTYGDYTVPIKDWHTPTQALNSKYINEKIHYERHD